MVHELHPGRLLRFRLQAGRKGREPLEEREIREDVLLEEPDFRVRAATLDHAIPVLAFAFEETKAIHVRADRLAELGLAPGPWLSLLKRLLLEGRGDRIVPLPDGSERKASDLDAELTYSPGQKLAYATDLDESEANQRALSALASEARILYCEATFVEEDRELARATQHLTARGCARIAASARVEKLVPFHFSKRYEHDPGRVYREVMEAFPATVVARRAPIVRSVRKGQCRGIGFQRGDAYGLLPPGGGGRGAVEPLVEAVQNGHHLGDVVTRLRSQTVAPGSQMPGIARTPVVLREDQPGVVIGFDELVEIAGRELRILRRLVEHLFGELPPQTRSEPAARGGPDLIEAFRAGSTGGFGGEATFHDADRQQEERIDGAVLFGDLEQQPAVLARFHGVEPGVGTPYLHLDPLSEPLAMLQSGDATPECRDSPLRRLELTPPSWGQALEGSEADHDPAEQERGSCHRGRQENEPPPISPSSTRLFHACCDGKFRTSGTTGGKGRRGADLSRQASNGLYCTSLQIEQDGRRRGDPGHARGWREPAGEASTRTGAALTPYMTRRCLCGPFRPPLSEPVTIEK